MASVSDLLAKIRPFADANAAPVRDETTVILERHSESFLVDVDPRERRARAERLYQEHRHRVKELQHISINISLERLKQLSIDGRITPTVPPNQWDRLPRDNVERLFWEGDVPLRPVYGALNVMSSLGGAPDFNPNHWIRIAGASVEHKATFTSRNTYHVVNPALGDFDPARALTVLFKEAYLWDSVADCYLARFGHPDAQRTDDFIEAQIWGRVEINEIEAIFVKDDVRDELARTVTGPECRFGDELAEKIHEIPPK